MTFIAARRRDRILAPWVIDGPINGELFTLYVGQELALTLAKGAAVILDNLGSHKGKEARDLVRARGAHLLFLAPCSPDLNPIEQVFGLQMRATDKFVVKLLHRHGEIAWAIRHRTPRHVRR